MPDQRNQSSFIPKTDSLQSTSRDSKRSGGSALILVSLGLFIVAILAAGGLFLYQQNLRSTLSDRQEKLQQKRSAFDPALIDELAHTDARLDTARSLLENHTALSPIFSVVESVTLQSVQFQTMEISHRENESEENNSDSSGQSGPNATRNQATTTTTVNLSGVGPGYATIALQSSALADHDKDSNPILSNLALNNDGTVECTVEFTVPTNEVLYKNTTI
jgi:hypothetical protein